MVHESVSEWPRVKGSPLIFTINIYCIQPTIPSASDKGLVVGIRDPKFESYLIYISN